jgi:hypothetical protein
MDSVKKKITDGVIGKKLLERDITHVQKIEDDDELKAEIRKKITNWAVLCCSIMGGVWSIVQFFGFYYGWFCRG